MNLKQSIHQQTEKIISRLFVFMGNKDLHHNQSINLIVNPQILQLLFDHLKTKDASSKIQALQYVSSIFSSNRLNCSILFKRDNQILEFNVSIFDSIIDFLFTLKGQKIIIPKLIQLFKPFCIQYPISCKNIKKILSKIASDFFHQNHNTFKLQLAIKMLKMMLTCQLVNDAPTTYFSMFGQNSGLHLISEENKWIFSKGFYFYTYFYLDHSPHQKMKLFSIVVGEDQFLLQINEQNMATVKVFGVAKHHQISILEPCQWYSLKVVYILKSGFIRDSFQCSVYIDGQPFSLLNLPIPNISLNDQINELNVGNNFYGRINFAALSRQEIKGFMKNGINSWKNIQHILNINKKSLRQFVLFYSSLMTTKTNQKQIAFDIISKNHAEVGDNTAIIVNWINNVNVNYYGGLYTYLPLLYVLKFYKYNQYPTALQQILELLTFFFVNKFNQVQDQAVNCQMFSILSLLINQIDERYATQKCVTILQIMKNSLDQQHYIFKQFFLKFLWKIKLTRLDPKMIEGIVSLISQYYQTDFQWAYQVMPICQILRFIIDNFQTSQNDKCCYQHYLQRIHQDSGSFGDTIQDQELMNIKNTYQKSQSLVQLMKSIILKIFSKKNFKLLESMQILLNFLMFDYSTCFKKIILDVLLIGCVQNPQVFLTDYNILSYLYHLLSVALISSEVQPIIKFFQIFLNKSKTIKTQKLELQVIDKIGQCFQKIYLKKYINLKIRSHSQVFQLKTINLTHRKSQPLLHKFKQQVSSPEIKQKQYFQKLLKIKKIKVIHFENDKTLFQIIIQTCFQKKYVEGIAEYFLKNDEYVAIIQPYFKICCQKFKKNIIDMLRNTVLLTCKNQQTINKIDYFDRLFKFLLTEFILRQLDPHLHQYQSNDQNNYIIRNVFFIIDYIVMGIKNDWDHLYVFIMRLSALLQLAKQDIKQKIKRDDTQILVATKICVRKFFLRVIKLAEKNVSNLPNLVFLVYLMVFSNKNLQKNQKIFTYFNQLQQFVFISNLKILNKDSYQPIQSNLFIDDKLILQTIKSLKISQTDLEIQQNNQKVINYINYYLQLQNDSVFLQQSRQVYLSKAIFKSVKDKEQSESGKFKNLISNFISFQNPTSDKLYVSVAEIISLLLGLCIQSSVNDQNHQILKQSLQKLQQFFKMFTIVCSRDGLKKSQHNLRNQKMPQLICYHIIHFLYQMLQNQYDIKCSLMIQQTIYNLISFLGLIITVLNQKLGNPNDLQQAKTLSQILKNVEEYNFFSYNILKGILNLPDIKQFPTFPKQKAMDILRKDRFKEHFKNTPQTLILNQIIKVTQIYKDNIGFMQNQIVLKLKKNKDQAKQSQPINVSFFYSQQQFTKTQINHLKMENLFYRNTKRIWRKVWKRLRLYHYYWSASMNQRESIQQNFKKYAIKPYHHKFAKFVDSNGVRSILQVQPTQPWNVKKRALDLQIQYRQSKFMFNLYKVQQKYEKKQRSLIQKVFQVTSNQQQQRFYVEWIKHNSKRKGILEITADKLKFSYDSTFQQDSHLDFTSFVLAEHKPLQKYWDIILITEIIQRRYLTKQQCLLIEFQDNSTLIFNFIYQDTNQFLSLMIKKQAQKSQKMNLLKLNNINFFIRKFPFDISEQVQKNTQKWKNNELSNLQYLILINKFAGRSYLDPVQFPVMPWIISDYQNQQYSLRDLSKPLGALGSQSRRQHYLTKIENYNSFDDVPPYHYGTHYSNPGMVFNFLIRISPYTQASKTLQGGKFDLSDRLFNSIKICWHSVTTQISDVRQLIPQFFYLPQFLLNINQYDLGKTQSKQRVHNVKMPTWAKDAYQFIFKHRRQLQKKSVTENINKWIDLIFGFKQKGKTAEQNLNVYYYLTYQNCVDLHKITNDVQKKAIQAQIIHFGQTPSQIFKKPHQQKRISEIIKEYKKIRYIGTVQSNNNTVILSKGKNSEDYILLFNDYKVYLVSVQKQFKILSKVDISRQSTKQNLFFVEDLSYDNRICAFKNNKFLAVCSYVNGDLIIFDLTTGKKIEEKKGHPKTFLYINKAQNLIVCGSKNGLLQVFQIIYGQKDNVVLVKISEEFYLNPIQHISENGNFYSITCGNLVIISKFTRTMAYIYDKFKKKGSKMIRSFQSKKKVLGSFLSFDPLPCVMFYNNLHIYIYSINGQYLTEKSLQIKLQPILIKTENHSDSLWILLDKQIGIFSVPYLQQIKRIALPSKEYVQMKMLKDICYLISNEGEIICIKSEEF